MAQQECCHRSPPPLSRVGSPEASTPSPKTTRQPCHATQQAHPCQPIPQHVPRADRSRAWSVAQGLGVFLWVYGCACPGTTNTQGKDKKMVTINSDHTVTLLIGEVEALVAFHNYLAGFTTKGLDENTLRYGIQALSSLLIVRDMFLIDSFHGCTMQDFLDNVEHPFAEKTVHYVRSSLDLVFRDDNFTLDTRRIHRAIALLTTMLELKGLSQRETVTVYGTLSYLYWLKNDTTNARIIAQKALTIDEKYWLARITTTALLHHITPHWCQK